MELPDDPKQADIDAALDRVRDAALRAQEERLERPPCPAEDHLGRACAYGEGHDLSVFPHRFTGPVTRRPDGEQTDVGPVAPVPAVELYDQDRRVFAEGSLYGVPLTVDVDADSPEGRAISAGSLEGLSIASDEPVPDPHAGLGLQGAARMLAEAVRDGSAEVRTAGSDGGGRTIWRVSGLGPNIVHFGQAHVREALERRWLVIGNGGVLQASPFLTDEAGS